MIRTQFVVVRGLFLLIAISCHAAAEVNVPPGYYLAELMPREAGYSSWPSINNHGDVVWSTQLDLTDPLPNTEIFLYRDGVIEQLTDDNAIDDFPSINDDGTIVWSRVDVLGYSDIVRYRDGTLEYITDEALNDDPQANIAPVVNNLGQIAWYRNAPSDCPQSGREIYFYDGESVQQLTALGMGNQSVDLNDHGEVVWTQYNFCTSPWTSKIMMYADNAFHVISDSDAFAQGASINNNRYVTWTHRDPALERNVVSGWRDGVRFRVDDNATIGELNNRDELIFIRLPMSGVPWQLVLNSNGVSRVIAAESISNIQGDINDRSEIAWQFGGYPAGGIRAILRHQMADLNCDQTVSVNDIHPFIMALIDHALYSQQYPSCDPLLADMNDDGFVTVSDIGPFVGAILNQ